MKTRNDTEDDEELWKLGLKKAAFLAKHLTAGLILAWATRISDS